MNDQATGRDEARRVRHIFCVKLLLDSTLFAAIRQLRRPLNSRMQNSATWLER
jgi:hypothetical protein